MMRNAVIGPVSLRISPRAVIVAIAMILLIFLAALAGTVWGDYPMSPARVWATLTGDGERMETFVVMGLRLPRLVVGVLAGAAFGLSGAIFQSLARNPLASPDLIGFNAGAALGAVIVITVMDAAGHSITVGALVGGLLTAATIALLAWDRGLVTERLVLVGIGGGFTLLAISDLLLIRSDIFDAAAAARWLTGSLNARGWDDALRIAPALVVLLPAAFLLARPLNRLELGEEVATGLGIRVSRMKVAAVVVATCLAAVATSVAGPIAFVALIAGPLARRLSGTGGASLGTAALTGALMLTAADLCGRLLFAPMILPAGLFTAAMGAPFLLWLLIRQVRAGTL